MMTLSRYARGKKRDVLTLWKSKKFDTNEIAHELLMREGDVEKIIHRDREENRRTA